MARILRMDSMMDAISKTLSRSFESGHINFLFGAGASRPAISIAGTIEREIADLFERNDEAAAYLKLYEFLEAIQVSTNNLIDNASDPDNLPTLHRYREFLGVVSSILAERRTALLPRQASIFTTNYDLFLEQASSEHRQLRLTDGFARTPALTDRFHYSSHTFFSTISSVGTPYNYRVEIPSVNLIKLHGSLSWKKDGDEILYSVTRKDLLSPGKTHNDIREFVESYAVVLPRTTKFRATLMERTYYELLRLFTNEMDREGTVLVVFGFSFGDEHILKVTQRALNNPTLRLVIFAYSENDANTFDSMFHTYNNVEIISPESSSPTDFTKFNQVLRSVLPKIGGR